MDKFVKSLGVSGFGLVTSLATAVAVTAVANMTTFNVFTFSIWLIVPVGALLTGFAAASGYYLGSHYLHQRPTWHVLVQMVVIAAITNLLIYYFEYRTLILDDGTPASQAVGFGKYMNVFLTHQEIRTARGAQVSTPVGDFGYWLASIQFVGFLVGGLCIYGWLVSSPFCKLCNKYYRKKAERARYFGNPEAASEYYDGLFSNYVNSEAFAKQACVGSPKVVQGPRRMMIKTTLLGCPQCKGQVWRDEVSVWSGRDWKSQDKLARLITIPEGVDLTEVLKGTPRLAAPPDAA